MYSRTYGSQGGSFGYGSRGEIYSWKLFHLMEIMADILSSRRIINLFCDLSKLKGHTKEICYGLVGYPPDYKFKEKGNERNGTGGNERNSTTCNVLAEEKGVGSSNQNGLQFNHG
ncbi:hypothetical protein HAX54_018366 [Datura stramonium]|uniref:Uncharacterized protein n=1 Tax=Datura stramonium TaxID=4076 RepID=A0ABS8UPA1_DATST|nr:hypothetical protein [Datura stramonium]